MDANALFDFLVSYKREHQGNTPTVAQMMQGIGAHSTSTIHRWLNWLARANRITRAGREICVPGARWEWEQKGE